jgi:hypothetical protein
MFDQRGGKQFLEVVGLGESFQAAEPGEEAEPEAHALEAVVVETYQESRRLV